MDIENNKGTYLSFVKMKEKKLGLQNSSDIYQRIPFCIEKFTTIK